MSVELINVSQAPKPDRSWLGNRASRTHANPRHTLFGTTLQQKDQRMIDELKAIDLKKYDEEQRSQSHKSHTISPQLESFLGPGAQFLQHSKRHLVERAQSKTRAERHLSSIEEQSRYFTVGQDQAGLRDQQQLEGARERPSSSQKWSIKDLEHAGDMNHVGLRNGTSAYNHHKYGSRPPVHQYCLIGDPLVKGMDFTEVAEKPNHIVPPMQPFKRHRDPYAVPREAYMRADGAPGGGRGKLILGADLNLPPNIQHQFGTQVCDMLLADPEQVKATLEKQRRSREMSRRPHQPLERIELSPENLEPSYAQIGTSTRANIFGPSVTRHHKIGTMKENFSDEVHRRRVAETDEHRYQRDELSQWWQHETIRGVMKRKWEQYEAERPKLKVNWDRNARRPPPKLKPPEPKPKAKPRPKPAKEATPAPPMADDIVFEDIEFKTPPLTPPPPRPPPAPAPPPDDDDNFWEFYDQGVPLP